MSSAAFRNAVKRKTHKERAQPAQRRKLGLLEKKKDYKLRAADFHKKQTAIQILRQKAEFRNDDEFYRSMDKVQTRDGVHVLSTTTANKYTREELQVMKTQDIGYIALKAQVDAKKVEKLEQSLHRIGEPVKRQHIVFVDDTEELQTVQPPQAGGSAGGPAGGPGDRNGGAGGLSKEDEAELQRSREEAYRQLQQRKERLSKLQGMVQHMELQRALMGPGTKTKQKTIVDGKEVAVYKWRRERKR